MCIFCDATPARVRKYGKIFGYPQCCIEEFVRDQEIMDATGQDIRNEDQINIAVATDGFVPCKMHTQMIVNGEMSVKSLFKNRNEKKSEILNKKAYESEINNL